MGNGGGGLAVVSVLISLAVTAVIIVAQWKIFVKAGEAGWKSIVPILNVWTLFTIIYGQGWKCLLLLVPILNAVMSIAYCIRLAQVFGKGIGFGILTIFFSPIMMCVLGFGDADYSGPVDSFL